MPQHELPTVVFQPFPHGRPKEYQQPQITDIMLAMNTPHRMPLAPAPAPPSPAPPVMKQASPPTPHVEVEQSFKSALVEEIERMGEPVKITKFATQFARATFTGGTWKVFEQRKVSLLRQVEQLIRDKVLERIARRFVTIPRPIHPDKRRYFS